MWDLTKGAAEKLGYYVYVYIDPETEKPFYIGKGKGDRFKAHLKSQPGTVKGDKINKIKNLRMEPRIDFLRWGLSEDEANLVEAAAIDLIGIKNLVNRKQGHHSSHGRTVSFVPEPDNILPTISSKSKGSGRITSKDLMKMIEAEPIEVDEKAILITINQLYRSDMSAQELEEATRGIWVLNPRRAEKADYIMAVFRGIVREVYEINGLHKAGTLPYETRDDVYDPDKWEFSVERASENIRQKYLGRFVGKGHQNPIHYVNVPKS